MGPVVSPVTRSLNLPSVNEFATVRKGTVSFPGENRFTKVKWYYDNTSKKGAQMYTCFHSWSSLSQCRSTALLITGVYVCMCAHTSPCTHACAHTHTHSPPLERATEEGLRLAR